MIPSSLYTQPRAQPRTIPPPAGQGTAGSSSSDATSGAAVLPDIRTVTINGSTGVYAYTDKWSGNFDPMSLTVESPGAVTIYFSLGSGAEIVPPVSDYSCPPQGMVTRPIAVNDLVFACDPDELGDDIAQIIVCRWRTLQPYHLASA